MYDMISPRSLVSKYAEQLYEGYFVQYFWTDCISEFQLHLYTCISRYRETQRQGHGKKERERETNNNDLTRGDRDIDIEEEVTTHRNT